MSGASPADPRPSQVQSLQDDRCSVSAAVAEELGASDWNSVKPVPRASRANPAPSASLVRHANHANSANRARPWSRISKAERHAAGLPVEKRGLVTALLLESAAAHP